MFASKRSAWFLDLELLCEQFNHSLYQSTNSQLFPLAQDLVRLIGAEDVRHRSDVEEVSREVEVERSKCRFRNADLVRNPALLPRMSRLVI